MPDPGTNGEDPPMRARDAVMTVVLIGSVALSGTSGVLRAMREPPEVQEAREPHEVKEAHEPREIREAPEPREVKEAPEPGEVKEPPEPPEVKEAPEAPEAIEAPEVRESVDAPDVKEAPETHEVAETHGATEPRDIREATEGNEPAEAPERSESEPAGSTRDQDSTQAGTLSDRAQTAASIVVTPAAMQDVARREAPDFDRAGFPVRNGEIVAIDPGAHFLNDAQDRGFTVVSDDRLDALGIRVVRVRGPVPAQDGLDTLRSANPGTPVELDHYFTVGDTIEDRDGVVSRHTAKPMQRNPDTWIGVIDTPVQRNAALRSIRLDSHEMAAANRQTWHTAHGNVVASILARQGIGRVSSVNVFVNDQQPFASADAIARAVDWLVARGVPIINISISGPRNALIDRVIAEAVRRGVAIVAAAGNGGPGAPPAYPGASPGAIAVTAVDRSLHVYMHANQGDYITVAAQGVEIQAAGADGRMKTFSGTSFAAPVVAARLAHCIGSRGRHQTGACIRRMEDNAIDLGTRGRDPVYGYGLVSE